MRHIALTDAQIPAPGKRALLRTDGLCIAIFNVNDTLYAIDDSCPHAGSSLFMGRLDGLHLQCPAHGLRFHLQTGCMPGGKGLAVQSYSIGLVDGHLSIAVPDGTPITPIP
jgi:3-phenylpropionate/trans-cinnamate dioxygenase ferredoxin subunit